MGSVFPFRFAFGWELFFSGLSSSLESTADWGTGKLSSSMVVLASSIPCHLWTGVCNTPSRESTVFGPAAISMLCSCGSDVTCGSWSGSAASHLVVFRGRRNVRRRSMPELWKTEAEALLCVLFVFSFKLKGVSVNWVCTVYFYAI